MSVKLRIHKTLEERSVIRVNLHPTRRNLLHSLLYIALAAPLVPFVSLALATKRIWSGPLRLVVVAPETAFSFFVGLMELLRGRDVDRPSPDLVIVLDKWPHVTFGRLYGVELSTKVFWRTGPWGVFQQALLLQPSQLVEVERLDWRDLRKDFPLPTLPMRVPSGLDELYWRTKQQLNCSGTKLVALAVYTLDYDVERSPYPGYASTRKRSESIGSELTDGIDFLRSSGVDVILLGSPDTGRSRIPRTIPRLAEFGSLGGPHEVAIASRCDYFWLDAVGAAWLCTPFRRPWFITNQYSLRTEPYNWPMTHLALPIRFKSGDGRLLTIREELAAKPPFSKVNEYSWIRNSPEEIVDAHREMLARLSGTWVETKEAIEVQRRYEEIFSEFPKYFPMKIATTFLMKHQYLLN